MFARAASSSAEEVERLGGGKEGRDEVAVREVDADDMARGLGGGEALGQLGRRPGEVERETRCTDEVCCDERRWLFAADRARPSRELSCRELDSTLSSASVHLLLPDLLTLTTWQAT